MGESLRHPLAFFRTGLRRTLGWHFAYVCEIENLLPHVCITPIDHVWVELIQSQIRFLLFGTVAFKAVFRQIGTNQPLKSGILFAL